MMETKNLEIFDSHWLTRAFTAPQIVICPLSGDNITKLPKTIFLIIFSRLSKIPNPDFIKSWGCSRWRLRLKNHRTSPSPGPFLSFGLGLWTTMSDEDTRERQDCVKRRVLQSEIPVDHRSINLDKSLKNGGAHELVCLLRCQLIGYCPRKFVNSASLLLNIPISILYYLGILLETPFTKMTSD